MHKKRKIFCQVFINVLQKTKEFKSFPASSCKVEMTSKNSLANGRRVQFIHVSFSHFAPAFFIQFLLVINTLRQRIFYKFKYLKKIATVNCIMEKGFV